MITKILKIIAWTIMAAVLAVVAMVMCTLNMLKPEHLTAVTTAVANKMLDADVSIGLFINKLSYFK